MGTARSPSVALVYVALAGTGALAILASDASLGKVLGVALLMGVALSTIGRQSSHQRLGTIALLFALAAVLGYHAFASQQRGSGVRCGCLTRLGEPNHATLLLAAGGLLAGLAWVSGRRRILPTTRLTMLTLIVALGAGVALASSRQDPRPDWLEDARDVAPPHHEPSLIGSRAFEMSGDEEAATPPATTQAALSWTERIHGLPREAALGSAIASTSDGLIATGRTVEQWQQIKTELFGDRVVKDAGDLIALETPYRALDAAVVPVEIRSTMIQTRERYITNLFLVIDMNPSPIAAVFRFPGDRPWETISTRVRVNAYTHVRVLAETNDGDIYMASNFVKAAGGCSAPSLKDPAKAAANIGKMKLVLPDEPESGGATWLAKLLIRHPNSSGLQFDQVARQYIPADYIRNIDVRYQGRPLFSVDTDISISEDPAISFGFIREGEGDLDVRVTDSEGRDFSRSFAIPAASGKG